MKKIFSVGVGSWLSFIFLMMGGWAMSDLEIPTQAPHDLIMASSAEIQGMSAWVEEVFTGSTSKPYKDTVVIEVIRQDFCLLQYGESCLETPLTIGERRYEHGLGTHANSELKVSLPAGSKTFMAEVGVDNNHDTQGERGSVEFSIEIRGQEVFRSPVLHGGDAPFPVSVDIPEGAEELFLKVGTTPDGPGWDQADWAEARLIRSDGKLLWLDEKPANSFFLRTGPPFSFTYGGEPSQTILSKWSQTSEVRDSTDRIIREIHWTDSATGLSVEATATSFKEYAAVEWVLSFTNRGTQDTSILEDIQALDLQLKTGKTKRTTVLHQITGDVCSERSFMPFDTNLETGKAHQLAPVGGRSSNGTFPFFNLEYREEGVITGIGWSGQWQAQLERSEVGVTRLKAGMERTHLLLHPGERIRTPRILLMHWKGDRLQAHNRFRRLMLFHYTPQENGHPVRLPVVSQCFDRYSWTRPEWATEAGQIEAAKFAHQLGCDTHWLDAAWFEGGFPNGVGNWAAKLQEFPNGLKPVSDACHHLGLKFVLWFEPERVAEGSLVSREHPEYVFGGEKGGLFKLNDPVARRWLTDLLSTRITEYGIDIYRNDFNMAPLDFWRKNDAPDRQGITEIRYVEGLYAMWDELRFKHPGLLIDNCSSGGRRIDLETCSRSVPFWRSDTSCTPGHPDWNQGQTYGLSHYIPLFMACGWTPDPYTFRSSATAGAICQWAYLEEGFPLELAQATIQEVKENQKYWYGDFYPITGASVDGSQWMAYQYHRADLEAGIVLAFRHKESNYSALEVSLKGLVPAHTYTIDLYDEARQKTTQTMTGQEALQGWELKIPKGSSLLIRYCRKH
jgi:alpha-galactosidase